mmetsp:Transcript_22403/g.84968  ORF Transcript_22403/g.84968 Transcript_22403/m.84968 type:complete len:291 (-) Transcript_22403:256-1128(-)
MGPVAPAAETRPAPTARAISRACAAAARARSSSPRNRASSFRSASALPAPVLSLAPRASARPCDDVVALKGRHSARAEPLVAPSARSALEGPAPAADSGRPLREPAPDGVPRQVPRAAPRLSPARSRATTDTPGVAAGELVACRPAFAPRSSSSAQNGPPSTPAACSASTTRPLADASISASTAAERCMRCPPSALRPAARFAAAASRAAARRALRLALSRLRADPRLCATCGPPRSSPATAAVSGAAASASPARDACCSCPRTGALTRGRTRRLRGTPAVNPGWRALAA